jgi:hypothetical protein
VALLKLCCTSNQYLERSDSTADKMIVSSKQLWN